MNFMRLTGVAVVGVLALAGCSGSEAEPEETGQVELNLMGYAASGNVYRLRDAVVMVQGPEDTIFFNTEDDPYRGSLFAEVPVGSYYVFLQEGWRLERQGGGMMGFETVEAQLLSPNPSYFDVYENQNTLVALRFRAGTDVIGLDRGSFDIVLEVEEQSPPGGGDWYFANYPGSRGAFDPEQEWNGTVSCPETCGALGLAAVGARFVCNLFGSGDMEGCTPETDGQYGTANCGWMVQDGIPQTQNGNTEDCTSYWGADGIMSCVTGSCSESVTYHALECQCQAF